MNSDEEAQAKLRETMGEDAYNRYVQGDMPKEDQAEFDKLVKLEPHELQDSQKHFLAARRDYLTKELKDKFAGIINEVLDFNAKKDGLNEEAGQDENTGGDEENKEPVAPKLTRAQLTEAALALGIPQEAIDEAKKNADIEKLIADKEAEDAANQG